MSLSSLKTRFKHILIDMLFLVFFFCIQQTYGQSIDDLKQQAMKTQELTLRKGDSVEVVRIGKKLDGAFLSKPDRYYAWLGAGAIKYTQGGYGGSLLDGPYALFNLNKDLLESGNYDNGLREGSWRGWYADGGLRYMEVWKEGLRNGRFQEFYPDGTLKREGKYKQGRLHGRVDAYDAQGKVTKDRYRVGELRVEKAKPETDWKNKLNPGTLYMGFKKIIRFKKGSNPSMPKTQAVQSPPGPASQDAATKGKDDQKRKFRLPFGKKAKS